MKKKITALLLAAAMTAAAFAGCGKAEDKAEKTKETESKVEEIGRAHV